MTITADQYKEAARKAYAGGDVATARSLLARAQALPVAPVNPQRAYMEARARGEMPAPVPLNLEGLQAQRNIDAGNTPLRGTNAVEQFGVGSQSGIASALGFPVDAVTGAINGVGQLTGGWEPIANPVGGSNTFSAMMEPFRRGIPDAQNTGQRFARRIGEEVGASAAMLPVAFMSPAARAKPLQAAAVEGASALGSGVGASVAGEIAPDSVIMEIAGAMMGGMPAASVAQRATGTGATNPVVRSGIEDQRARAADAYGVVRADQRVLPQGSVDDMALGLSSRMDAERINPMLQPGSQAILDAVLRESSGPMRIEDIENLRRITTSAMPATASPADRRLGGMMTDEITTYLDGLQDPVADALVEGRNAHRRASAASAVEDATTRAQRRAARTGSGGNEINATRQNIAAMIENPRKSRSFKPDELAQMDEIVMGSTGQNVARRLSRFAPSSGGLSAMLGVGGALASPAVALPIMAVTEGAKALGERSTRKSVQNLLQSLAPDRVIKPGDEGLRNIIAALMAARTSANAQ